MIFFNKKKNKKEEENQFEKMDFQKINNEISEYINKTNFLQDYSVDIYRDFVDIEKNIKIKDSETKNNIKNIKNFLENSSKENFYLRNFLENILETFNELSLDSVSLLKSRRFFYTSILKYLGQKKSKLKTNKGIILKTETFRYGGDEFSAIIIRDIGMEVVFFDLMYLNYFNDLIGYAGGDMAIYAASRIIEDTLKSFEGKATKTRNIMDKILENFAEFKFSKEYKKLNKIIFHVDIGYSNDIEIKEIEKEIGKSLSIEDMADIMISLAETRACIQKKSSKLYLLSNLYKLSKNNKNIGNILNGYLSFTKNPFNMEYIIKDVCNNSKNDKEINEKIVLISIELEKGKKSDRNSILSRKIFDKATSNIIAIVPKISIEEIIKKWGID